ncbi:hypothetical protein CC80DRAFT_545754 [Byssothecium circinans]|uniref:BAH domain-containing protein n=1 Tax=Byssothecium circinans TaxID=147558 RepID=A0A6A5UE42_9PLEO|nr:hypothetical protein CC80DRAFT_545754 [Byssothecium circinans]
MARLSAANEAPPEDAAVDAPQSTTKSASKKRKRSSNITSNFWDTFEGFKLKPLNKKRKPEEGLNESSVGKDVIFEGTHLTDRPFAIAEYEKQWRTLSRYRKFTFDQYTFAIGDTVFVKHSQEEKTRTEDAPVERWIAKILEIRARDAMHVYLRVYWLYRPEDLPGGRQSYHGPYELIASNHMDLIEATTVDELANVSYYEERPDEAEILSGDELFYRQSLDVTKSQSKQLSELPKYCIDKAPYDPNSLLVQCDTCKQWLHGHCLEQAAQQDALAAHSVEDCKKGAKRKSKDGVALMAEISATSGHTRMTITDRRTRSKTPKSWTVPIKCLICKATIEDSEESDIDANDDAATTATQDNIDVGIKHPSTPANKSDEEEESILNGEMSSPAKQNTAEENPLAPAATGEDTAPTSVIAQDQEPDDAS